MGTQASEFHFINLILETGCCSVAQADLVVYHRTRLLSDVLMASLRATVWVAEILKNSL